MTATIATATPLNVAVLLGTSREGRFGPTIAGWFLEHAGQRQDIELDALDLAEAPFGLAPGAVTEGGHEDADAVGARLATADAFVVITPEYNHSFPAVLKSTIDAHHSQWQAKPVGFVSYGGLGGGLRAVEQLRLVFAELHAATMRDSVSFHNAWDHFDGDGQLVEPTVAEGATKGMLDQLVWWGHALRDARATRPYGS